MSLRQSLWPLGLTYRGVTGFRNWAYDKGLRKTAKVKCKVISVGNVTVGGTGKTPTVLWLIDQLKKRKADVGVVSRGYKRLEKGVLEVDTSSRAGVRFGDEPALIKFTHPEIPVFVGEKRADAATALLEKGKVDVIICDDAFQHRSLHRDLNILLLDTTEPVENYRLLPVGRAREALGPALKRADFIVATKANLISPEDYQEWLQWLKGQTDAPILRADYEFKGFRSGSGAKLDGLSGGAFLVSGIAKPETLIQTFGDRVKIVKHKSFPDHHRYTDLEVEIFLDEASSLGARWILTTAKDAIKLGAFPRLSERLAIAEMNLKVSGETKDFYEALDRLVR